MEQTRGFFARAARCDNTSVTSDKFIDVRSVLHGQVSLAAANQIYVIYGAMNA